MYVIGEARRAVGGDPSAETAGKRRDSAADRSTV